MTPWKITLTPVRSDAPCELVRQNDVLMINNDAVLLEDLCHQSNDLECEGGHPMIVGPVEKVGSTICVTIAVPHSVEAEQSQKVVRTINCVTSGPIEDMVTTME